MSGENKSSKDRNGEGGTTASDIAALEVKIHRGLWPLVVFLSIGIWARTGFMYIPAMPEQWKSIMGQPPPPLLVNATFVLYLFSAMILSITRMAGQSSPGNGFHHVAYLAAFLGFYHVSGVLQESYWAVIFGGVAILTTEWYRNRLYYLNKILEL